MKVAVSCDHRGTHFYEIIVKLLSDGDHELVEVLTSNGEPCDYPDMAWAVGQAVADGRADRGVLVCGSGIGMSMAANKVPSVRAALVQDDIAAEMSRRHNDANVLCLSADMLSHRSVSRILNIWIETEFEGGRHARRVRKINGIEAGKDPVTITE